MRGLPGFPNLALAAAPVKVESAASELRLLPPLESPAASSFKALLMSAGGGLAVRKSLEAVGLRQPEPPLLQYDLSALPSLSPEELQQYLLDEHPHMFEGGGGALALPAPEASSSMSILGGAIEQAMSKTLSEPFVSSGDRLSPAALPTHTSFTMSLSRKSASLDRSCAELAGGADWSVVSCPSP